MALQEREGDRVSSRRSRLQTGAKTKEKNHSPESEWYFQGLRNAIPAEFSFKGFPMQFSHLCAPRYLPTPFLPLFSTTLSRYALFAVLLGPYARYGTSVWREQDAAISILRQDMCGTDGSDELY
eukprot:3941957-Rhodomonas_salina.4